MNDGNMSDLPLQVFSYKYIEALYTKLYKTYFRQGYQQFKKFFRYTAVFRFF